MSDIIKILPKVKGRIIKQNNLNELEIIREIRGICRQLELTDLWFQNESDSDLIEACIYQREVLNARYKYLINKLRRENISSDIISQAREGIG